MKATCLQIPEVLLIEPRVFGDDRGFFLESFNQRDFEKVVNKPIRFVQDNHSMSTQGVLRGLHYQLPPMAQGKLVRAVYGMIFDVAVDIRKKSPTYGRWVGEVLSSDNMRQLWIPEGFAHGFVTLSEKAEVLYKVTNYYSPDLERCLRWDDEVVSVDWGISREPVLSKKDSQGVSLVDAEVFL